MKFDVIIATYNREKSLEILVKQILECTIIPENIIIVDSSTKENLEIQKLNHIKYIRASHGNQPYQRYVGYLASNKEFLVFFDDDMRILNKKCFEELSNIYDKNENIGAIQPNFTSVHYFGESLPKSKLRNIFEHNIALKYIKYFSGVKELDNGKYWLAGMKGRRPKNMDTIEWFYGPVFSVKRKYLFQDFNFGLFDIFEKKLGMGEDAIIGYTLSKQAPIVYFDEKLFHHDDQNDSVYSTDYYTFSKKVSYSRLYLSYEYARLNQIPYYIPFFHYIWYGCWRLFSMGINLMIDYDTKRVQNVKGYFSGYIKAIQDYKKLQEYNHSTKWEIDAITNIS